MENRHLVLFRPGDEILLVLIDCYQKRISPRKGWHCAYRVLHGGTGCSGFVKNAIRQRGWRLSLPLSRERFHGCKQAARQLRAERNASLALAADGSPDQNGEQANKKSKGNNQSSGWDCAAFSCLEGGVEAAVCAACSFSPCS